MAKQTNVKLAEQHEKYNDYIEGLAGKPAECFQVREPETKHTIYFVGKIKMTTVLLDERRRYHHCFTMSEYIQKIEHYMNRYCSQCRVCVERSKEYARMLCKNGIPLCVDTSPGNSKYHDKIRKRIAPLAKQLYEDHAGPSRLFDIAPYSFQIVTAKTQNPMIEGKSASGKVFKHHYVPFSNITSPEVDAKKYEIMINRYFDMFYTYFYNWTFMRINMDIFEELVAFLNMTAERKQYIPCIRWFQTIVTKVITHVKTDKEFSIIYSAELIISLILSAPIEKSDNPEIYYTIPHIDNFKEKFFKTFSDHIHSYDIMLSIKEVFSEK